MAPSQRQHGHRASACFGVREFSPDDPDFASPTKGINS
jgi:hypothetical protein